MTDMDLAQALALRQKLADWSDVQLRDARTFVQSYEILLPRNLTNSQLHGFINVVRNATNVDAIKLFMQNQALKSERAGRSKEKMRDFWVAMQTRSAAFEIQAAEIARKVDQKWANDLDHKNSIHRQLLQKYLQHMLAEKLVLERTKYETLGNR